jgi:hypothetical protein
MKSINSLNAKNPDNYPGYENRCEEGPTQLVAYLTGNLLVVPLKGSTKRWFRLLLRHCALYKKVRFLCRAVGGLTLQSERVRNLWWGRGHPCIRPPLDRGGHAQDPWHAHAGSSPRRRDEGRNHQGPAPSCRVAGGTYHCLPGDYQPVLWTRIRIKILKSTSYWHYDK